MTAYKENPLILIVDDDPEICEFLGKVISAWGMKVECLTNPSQVLGQVRKRFYNIVLLDLIMPGKSGTDLLPEIVGVCPDTKVIIISGYADKEKAIKALRLGAFDFLEKPFELALLSHSLNRALNTQKAELELRKTYEDLKRSRDDLLAHKSQLEQLNWQLMETNNALSVLAQNIERTRQETEKRIVLKIRTLIIPIIEKVQQDRKFAQYHNELTILIRLVEDLTSGLAIDMNVATNLTSTEFRIASLIKNGLTTEEIADYLYISPNTAKTHRKNIRKKLNINNSQENLRSYLLAVVGEGAGPSRPEANP